MDRTDNGFVSVAIDGPVGAGKSSIARNAAKKLGYIYVDTGALYRAIGLYCTRNGADMADHDSIARVSCGAHPTIRLIEGVQYVYLNGEDVSEEIRLPEISMAASAVSAVPAVRAALLDLQRDMTKTNNVIKLPVGIADSMPILPYGKASLPKLPLPFDINTESGIVSRLLFTRCVRI